MVPTVDDARRVASDLERSYEVTVHGRIKFRVGRIVYLAFSADERLVGFAFPREERAVLVETEPHKFQLPRPSDLRFNWAMARMAALDVEELEELVLDAWTMVVPKKLWRYR
jgi:hypothetical protein